MFWKKYAWWDWWYYAIFKFISNKIQKDIDVYEYPFKIDPEVHEENVILKIQTLSYYDYYKNVLKVTIKDKNQPLILVYPKYFNYLTVDEKKYFYPKCYVPELYTMIGINDEDVANYIFMEKIMNQIKK